MQRYEEIYLPPDPVFPEDLAKLGFFVTEDDKIRVVKSPEQGPRFKINRNERINAVHIDTLHRAIRNIILDRLIGMCMNPFQLPATPGVFKPHAPVFVSSNLANASRIVVFIGELVEDIGVFSYRDICEEGISFGSVLKLARAVLGENPQDSSTALILANPGQQIWHNASGTPMTVEAFHSRVRLSAVARERPPSLRNAIQGNTSLTDHTEYIFEKILFNALPIGAKVDVLGLSEGGFAALMYLNKRWNIWAPHISCIGLVNPEQIAGVDLNPADLDDPQSFFSFFRDRGRAWILSSHSLGTRDVGLGMHGCNCYSSGEDSRIACMVSRALTHIMTWLNLMHAAPSLAENIVVVDGEPDPNSSVVRAMLEVKNGNLYDEGKTQDAHILEQLEGFVNGMALESDIININMINEKVDGEEANKADAVDGTESDMHIREVTGTEGGTSDGNNSDDSDVTVVPGPVNDTVVTGHAPPFDLKNLHDIREDTDEE